MERILIELLGITAGTFTTTSFIPQLVKILKTKSARDLSLVMFVVFTIGILLWLIYGILTASLAIIFANSITLVIASTILLLKIKYDRTVNER
ncbi:MAG: SemiSWEET transporter [Brevinematales bacterium]|nr:SemiSWEET transporter [Brevinematales bacterium]